VDLDQLRDQACASLYLLAPQLGSDGAQLVDQCLSDARRSFRDEFICRLSPAAWARITLIYFKHFVDTGCDVTMAEIVVAVVRDAIQTKRMDMLTLQLAQEMMDEQARAKPHPSLHVVKG
jgi:hypothetical protein